MDIEGKVAVVTGGGSGIGRAVAGELARRGARVVVGDLDGVHAEETAAAIRAAGQQAAALQGDAGAVDDIAALIAAATDQFGPVDIYVANAGIGGPPELLVSEEGWDHVLDINLRAHIRAANQLVPEWLERGSGYFVAVASAAGLLTQISSAPYAVTKHAAIAHAEWLAISYGDQGIGVSCVCPMGVNTALLTGLRNAPDANTRVAARAVTAAGAVLEPEQVAVTIVDAVRDGRFLVLPHPEVLDMYRQKGADYDRWIAGMRRYQRHLTSSDD